MGTQLERAFIEASKRPASEQDAIATLVFDALDGPSIIGALDLSHRRMEQIREGIARGRADVAAGRVVAADEVLTALLDELSDGGR